MSRGCVHHYLAKYNFIIHVQVDTKTSRADKQLTRAANREVPLPVKALADEVKRAEESMMVLLQSFIYGSSSVSAFCAVAGDG